MDTDEQADQLLFFTGRACAAGEERQRTTLTPTLARTLAPALAQALALTLALQ